MNIVTWNCNMAFRKKAQFILHSDVDIAVIQECENTEKLAKTFEEINHNEIIWHGNNPHKGIAIISFNECKITLHKNFNPQFEYILPVTLTKANQQLNLFAIWAMDNKENRAKSYIGQVWDALQFYDELITDKTILIGDFNSNRIWDKKRKIGNHSDVVHFLEKRKIKSIYHCQNKIEHGKETDPTLFLLKNENKKYHMDYCFASNNIVNEKTKLNIGRYDDWIRRSDHMPIWITDLNI